MKKLISLGMNCEVSYQIEKYVDKLDSSLFSWAYILDENKFLEALTHVDDIFENEISFARQTNDMFLDEKYQITFHGRTPKERLFDDEWNIKDTELYKETLDELISRIRHLKDKFVNDFTSGAEKVYLKKLVFDSDSLGGQEEYILKLYQFFEQEIPDGNFKLVIVVEQRLYRESFRKLENERLFIRTVDYFSPVDRTKDGADNLGWEKIIAEFYGDKPEGNSGVNAKELLKKIEELKKSNKQYIYENKKLKELLKEQQRWQDELYQAKQWLEEQYRYLIKK